MKWEEFVSRVSTRLFGGTELPNLMSATRRYKVIDFKPAFAYLFPEIVKDYTWWVHLDNDLLLGNVRHFVTEDMLANYDVISPVTPYKDMQKTWGPFTLYRNANLTNQLFHLTQDSLHKLFNNTKASVFDEWGRQGRQPGQSPCWNSSIHVGYSDKSLRTTRNTSMARGIATYMGWKLWKGTNQVCGMYTHSSLLWKASDSDGCQPNPIVSHDKLNHVCKKYCYVII